jgi:hypothetical protein
MRQFGTVLMLLCLPALIWGQGCAKKKRGQTLVTTTSPVSAPAPASPPVNRAPSTRVDDRAATAPSSTSARASHPASAEAPSTAPAKKDYVMVHVFVALCDNRNQGIAPVPEALGNGQDPKSNLYWGAMYGLKTFFRKSDLWDVQTQALFIRSWDGPVVYVFAQAYDGANMKQALTDFIEAAAGNLSVPVQIEDRVVQAGGAADLVAFVGHNGLMEMELDPWPANSGKPNPRGAVVLACKSREYFLAPLRRAKCRPLVTTTSLMAPEAYTLEAIIDSWANDGKDSDIRLRAAQAYAKYQKIALEPAKRMFVTGP